MTNETSAFPTPLTKCLLWKHCIFCHMLLYCDVWRVRAQEHEKCRTQPVHLRGSFFKFRNWPSCVNFSCIFGYLVGLLGLHKNCSKFCPATICSWLWSASWGAVKCAVSFHLCRTRQQSKLKVASKLKCLSLKRQDFPEWLLSKSLYLYTSDISSCHVLG